MYQSLFSSKKVSFAGTAHWPQPSHSPQHFGLSPKAPLPHKFYSFLMTMPSDFCFQPQTSSRSPKSELSNCKFFFLSGQRSLRRLRHLSNQSPASLISTAYKSEKPSSKTANMKIYMKIAVLELGFSLFANTIWIFTNNSPNNCSRLPAVRSHPGLHPRERARDPVPCLPWKRWSHVELQVNTHFLHHHHHHYY